MFTMSPRPCSARLFSLCRCREWGWELHRLANHRRRPRDAIGANSNQTAAGRLEDAVLALHLELRQGDWYPEAETGPSMKVYAFAEEGGPLQVPGPLIRVPEGVAIHLTVRNLLPVKAVMHGLHPHPGDEKVVDRIGTERNAGMEISRGLTRHL